MGSLDFLSPGGLVYPGSGSQQVPCGTPYAPPDPEGVWNQIFTLKELRRIRCRRARSPSTARCRR